MKSPIKKLLINLAAIIIVTSIAVTGVWFLYARAEFTGAVVSFDNMPLSVSIDFADVLLNTSAGPAHIRTNATIINTDGNLSYMLNISTIITDDESDTCDNAGDCELAYKFNHIVVEDEDIIWIGPGKHTLESNLSCMKLSCKQDVESSVTFIGT